MAIIPHPRECRTLARPRLRSPYQLHPLQHTLAQLSTRRPLHQLCQSPVSIQSLSPSRLESKASNHQRSHLRPTRLLLHPYLCPISNFTEKSLLWISFSKQTGRRKLGHGAPAPPRQQLLFLDRSNLLPNRRVQAKPRQLQQVITVLATLVSSRRVACLPWSWMVHQVKVLNLVHHFLHRTLSALMLPAHSFHTLLMIHQSEVDKRHRHRRL